jgi:hypothetical protein
MWRRRCSATVELRSAVRCCWSYPHASWLSNGRSSPCLLTHRLWGHMWPQWRCHLGKSPPFLPRLRRLRCLPLFRGTQGSSSLLPPPPSGPASPPPVQATGHLTFMVGDVEWPVALPPSSSVAPSADSLPALGAAMGLGEDCLGRRSFAVVASPPPLGRLARAPRGFQKPSSLPPPPPPRRLVASVVSP